MAIRFPPPPVRPGPGLYDPNMKISWRSTGDAVLGLMGLYDSEGILRFTGRDPVDCLAYAELFGLEQPDYSIESIEPLPQGLG